MRVSLTIAAAPPSKPQGGHLMRSVLRLRKQFSSGLSSHFDAVAAAKLAGAAAVGAKGVALVEQWIVKFL